MALRRGVYVEASHLAAVAGCAERRHALDVAAVLLVLGFDAVAGATSAARIFGMDQLGQVAPEPVLLTDAAAVKGTHRNGYLLRSAALPGHHRAVRHGVPVTSAARTVVDLARTRSFAEGVIMADSVLESLSRVAIHEQNLPAPRTQVTLGDAWGPRSRVDFLWDDVRVVGEADGLGKCEAGGSRTTRDIVRAEKRREEWLADAGFEVVRWGWDDANDPPRLAQRLRAAFARGAERHLGRQQRGAA